MARSDESIRPPDGVVSTGTERVPLAGGRSRRTANGVPILELHQDVVRKVAHAQQLLLDPARETVLLTGEKAFLHTPRARGRSTPDVVTFHIGGETLDEAAKSCIGAFEDHYADDAPSWVASTSDDLAEVIAEHYGCPIRGLDEELSA